MATAWYEPLREYARKASKKHPSCYGEDAVLFYLARWLQKEAHKRKLGPLSVQLDLNLRGKLGSESVQFKPNSFGKKKLTEVADNIASNLAADGERVEGVFTLNQEEYDKLRNALIVYARRYGVGKADQYADDALLKILPIVLTGTRPSCAGCKIGCRRRELPECAGCKRELGVDGPSNEYIFFQGPFLAWALAVLRHLIADDARCQGSLLRWRWDLILVDQARYASSYADINARRDEAYGVVGEMLKGIDELPGRPRSVMVDSMHRADVDTEVYEQLYRLAPELLGEVSKDKKFADDREIGEHLGISVSNVSTIRGKARKELAQRDYRWGEILDCILPHRGFSLALPEASN